MTYAEIEPAVCSFVVKHLLSGPDLQFYMCLREEAHIPM